jgi:tripartite ATP-independent periplasmic transporter solute receptor, DctP family
MKLKSLSALCAALVLTVAAVAQAQEPLVLKGGLAVDPTYHYYYGLEQFGKALEAKSNGRIKLEIFHSGQLGGERDLIEGLGLGTIDVAATSGGAGSSFVKELACLEMPYLFDSREQAYKAIDSPVGQGLLKKLESSGVIGLGYFENGMSQISNNVRPVKTPDDLKNIKVRVKESPLPIATLRAYGANPTPMAWAEVFPALQQKTIDGLETPLPAYKSHRLFEVQKYLSLLNYSYSPALFMFSQATMESLSAEDQAIVWAAAKEAIAAQRVYGTKYAEDSLPELRASGMEVTETKDIDIEAFKKASEVVYTEFDKEFGQLVKDLKAAGQ